MAWHVGITYTRLEALSLLWLCRHELGVWPVPPTQHTVLTVLSHLQLLD